jgi:signal transduction histidine kinase
VAHPLGADVPDVAVAANTATADKTILIEARRDGDRVILGVIDHGSGIPEADRKHAIERFVRLEASRTLPGSGLGLSLASAVATLHGGDLTLSDAQPGLRAILSIPARIGEGLAAPTPDVQQNGA